VGDIKSGILEFLEKIDMANRQHEIRMQEMTKKLTVR
jgi:hypothetical protein